MCRKAKLSGYHRKTVYLLKLKVQDVNRVHWSVTSCKTAVRVRVGEPEQPPGWGGMGGALFKLQCRSSHFNPHCLIVIVRSWAQSHFRF